MGKSSALIIFAKAPVPGQVKTRLQTRLSADECASLHSSFIIDTIKLARDAGAADIFLACHPDVEDPFFKKISSDFGVALIPQNGNDLGDRMENAIDKGLKMGYEKVIIIGSDSPDLPPEYIRKGFKMLDLSDMVIGPSADGGYYLIGGRIKLDVFEGIPWSTSSVFEMTLKKAEKQGRRYSVLNEWYDIDTWEDLQRFRGSGHKP